MKGNYTKFSAEAKADLDFVNFDKASVRFTFCRNSNDLCEVFFTTPPPFLAFAAALWSFTIFREAMTVSPL